jgi:hypothetical protein
MLWLVIEGGSGPHSPGRCVGSVVSGWVVIGGEVEEGVGREVAGEGAEEEGTEEEGAEEEDFLEKENFFRGATAARIFAMLLPILSICCCACLVS